MNLGLLGLGLRLVFGLWLYLGFWLRVRRDFGLFGLDFSLNLDLSLGLGLRLDFDLRFLLRGF